MVGSFLGISLPRIFFIPVPVHFLKEPDSGLSIAEILDLVKKKIQHLDFFYVFIHYIS